MHFVFLYFICLIALIFCLLARLRLGFDTPLVVLMPCALDNGVIEAFNLIAVIINYLNRGMII